MADAGLAGSASPFLRHGASQPVHWMPWGAEAFERAEREDRPVLLDIGAVWCHWCHVMDRESYEDETTAALINELYVPVKVDRDERPDVDARYQRAAQVLLGQGGWPLTAFLTPAGEAFYAGTYFPPVEGHGRPSFPRVLREVARIWGEERGRAESSATALRERLREIAQVESLPGELDAADVERAADGLARTFDARYGGFGGAPKFPNAGGLGLLLDRWLDTGDEGARDMLRRTLDAMGRGGVYDQLGGGFHRYATDARWLIPHFEKMAYDNGTLLALYARAASVLDEPFWVAIACGILDYYRDVAPGLVDAGGFPASQDADVGEDDDGDYWTWTLDEVRSALGDEAAVRAATMVYGLDDPATSMRADPARHVLRRAASPTDVARELGLTVDAARAQLADVRARLKDARDGRPRPFVDETRYAGWVALVAAGHIAAARHLDRRDAGRAAERALDRAWQEAFEQGRGIRRRLGDPAAGVYVDDQVHTARAFLDLFELTQNARHLERAVTLVGVLFDRFHDPDTSTFVDRPRDADAAVSVLREPARSIMDAPEPAANAAAVLVLARLHALTREPRYDDAARATARAFAGSAARFATNAGTYYRALSWLTGPVTTVVVVADDDALLAAALAPYRPRTVVRRFRPGAVDAGALSPELQAMVTADAPRAYVCAGRTCAAPVTRPEALRRLVGSFRG
ncbi:MAG: thioredoxin domain-containing protein [Gemmatimonadota bacterium]|jgi:uncharacterized protein YyaL (SSP411 family)